jgi:hypothetical protein
MMAMTTNNSIKVKPRAPHPRFRLIPPPPGAQPLETASRANSFVFIFAVLNHEAGTGFNPVPTRLFS